MDNTVKYNKRTFLTMGIKPAVELSYLTKEEQKLVYASIIYEDLTPSHAQAIKIRELSKKNKIDNDIRERIGVVFDGNNYPEDLTPNKLNNVLKAIYKNWEEKNF